MSFTTRFGELICVALLKSKHLQSPFSICKQRCLSRSDEKPKFKHGKCCAFKPRPLCQLRRASQCCAVVVSFNLY